MDGDMIRLDIVAAFWEGFGCVLLLAAAAAAPGGHNSDGEGDEHVHLSLRVRYTLQPGVQGFLPSDIELLLVTMF
jgi:hypothetical protein